MSERYYPGHAIAGWRWTLVRATAVSFGTLLLWRLGGVMPFALSALLLGGSVLLAACGPGLYVVDRLELQATTVERGLYALAFGSGLLSLVVFALGSTSALKSDWLALVPACGMALLAARMPLGWRRHSRLPPLMGWQRAIGLACLTLVVIGLLFALTPPTDYDGLMYHLVAPARYLAAGRIVPIVEIPQANFPDLIELVYLLPLSVANDAAPKVIHLGFGVATALLVFQMARRFFGDAAAWFALAAFAGTPLVIGEAQSAYVDLAWVFFTLLALYAVLVWTETVQWRWLLAGGLSLGLALATKYLALVSLLILAIVVVLHLWRRVRLPVVLGALASLLFPAILVAAPWYVRNIAWFGNPVFPFLVGGPGWDAFRLERYEYLDMSIGYGTRRLVDYLLLPVNIYLHSNWYGDTTLGFPPPLAWLAPFAFCSRARGVTTYMSLFVLAHFLYWAYSAQWMRLLIVVYPALSILAGAGAAQLWRRLQRRRPWPLLVELLTLVPLALSIALQWLPAVPVDQLAFVGGQIDRATFLTRQLGASYTLWSRLPGNARVFVIGYGASYYAGGAQIIPDATHDNWPRLLARLVDSSAQSIDHALCRDGITHVLISWGDYQLVYHYDQQYQQRTTSELTALQAFRTAAFEPLAIDPSGFELYRLKCD